MVVIRKCKGALSAVAYARARLEENIGNVQATIKDIPRMIREKDDSKLAPVVGYAFFLTPLLAAGVSASITGEPVDTSSIYNLYNHLMEACPTATVITFEGAAFAAIFTDKYFMADRLRKGPYYRE